MKHLSTFIILAVLLAGCKNENKENNSDIPKSEVGEAAENVEQDRDSAAIEIDPITHATAIINWGDTVIYVDPTGGATAFEGKEKPHFVLITDIHGDHLNAETLQAVELDSIQIIVPQAVKDELPAEMHEQLIVLNNGESQEIGGFNVEAIPMYNLPEDPEGFHPKGRGNGYVIQKGGKRLYIAGDTEAVPEMRNLKNIDMALVPMNLPYTMDVEQAAEGVLEFAPKQVYPYHFRGQGGFADVDKFEELIKQGNKDIEVVMLDWYPEENSN